jgi:hypothetical protein
MSVPCSRLSARWADRVAIAFDARPHGFLKLIFPILLRGLRAEEKANMGHIRAALERGHATNTP